MINYYGETLDHIHSDEDLLAYINDTLEYLITNHNLLRETMYLSKQQLKLNKEMVLRLESNEIGSRKIDELDRRKTFLDERREKINKRLKENEQKQSKWINDSLELDTLIKFGIAISAFESAFDSELKENFRKALIQMMQTDPTLYQRYLAWQHIDQIGIEEYLK